MTKKSIIVPLDGSRFGEWALPQAVGLARRHGNILELVSVFDENPSVAGWSVSSERVESALKEYLNDLAERVGSEWQVEANIYVLGGHPAEQIETKARHHEVELVVMATHGRGPLNRAWIGSVADNVVKHGSKPVMLIRPHDDIEKPPTEPRSFAHVLVPVDGSEFGKRSIEWAVRMGGKDARYTLLHVLPHPTMSVSPYLPHTIQETEEVRHHGRKKSEEMVADLAREFSEHDYQVATEFLESPNPGTVITDYASDEAVDLIIITTHGRTGIKRLLLGSVADKVIRTATVPVFLTRAHAS